MNVRLTAPFKLKEKSTNFNHTSEPALNIKEDIRLDYLDIPRSNEAKLTGLKGLRVSVIGAGPAGLVFAKEASMQGAFVTVVEKAGDPRGRDAGYTDRSFNITLDNVGRQVLADNRALIGGTWISGRAIHNPINTTDVKYTVYGDTSDAELVSIPRPILRQNLTNLAEEAGATLKFRACVTKANSDSGVIIYTDRIGFRRRLEADLIVFSDGLHSLADQENRAKNEIWPEKRGYITGYIKPNHNVNLSLNHIHFWHETTSDAYTVGIPNNDGSVALLIVSEFSDISEKTHPFDTPKIASERLKKDFPLVLSAVPDLAEQLPKMQRGRFSYKLVTDYRVGARGIIVGDSGCVVPPWAGFGANTAMYAAASLVSALSTNKQLDDALNSYNVQHKILARSIMSYVYDQGDFLSGPVKDDPAGRSDPALGPLILNARRGIQVEPETERKIPKVETAAKPALV